MKVLVMMSTYNGAKYIDKQISSILSQKDIDIYLLIRDDGSSDHTVSIINTYVDQEKIFFYYGNNMGPAYSFYDLVTYAKKNFDEFDYYAFADQDDFWECDKILVAVNKLETMHNKYRLYASALRLVDEDLVEIDSPSIETYKFPEYMFRNQCAGCTMVFNYPVIDLINRYKPSFLEMHDVWILRVLYCITNSEVYIDPNSYINYRQHENNVVGGKHDLLHVIGIKVKQLFGKNDIVYKTSYELLNGYKEMLNLDSKKLLEMVIESKQSYFKKWKLIRYVIKFGFSNRLRKVFFIWNVLSNNL